MKFKNHWAQTILLFFLASLLFTGCATSSPQVRQCHPFDFAHDTFSFSNELSWEYFFDADGKWTNRRREPPPEYSKHCFALAHAAKEFFRHAQFEEALPETDEKTYHKLIRQIVFGGDTRPDSIKIVVPGYANLKEFSRAHQNLLKQECGGAWRSYFQRGHWRIMLPFSRGNQEKRAEQFVQKLKRNEPLVVHLCRFPQVTSINHAVLVFDFNQTEKESRFMIYDPNSPEKPGVLTFDRSSRSFLLPSNAYFYGGKVNVYEIYHSCFY